jgi:uncharacterized protein (TIGR03437 family)
VTVAISGGGSGTVQATVLPASPGLFQYTAANGQPYVVAIKANGSVAGPSNPANRGENITIYVTGLGPLSPAIATNSFPASGSTPAPVYGLILGVANQGAPYNTAASAPDLIGVQTINFAVPGSITPGPVTISIGVQTPSGVVYSQGSTLNVQ